MTEYDLNHPNIKRRPFMTLNVSVVGKFYENLEDLYDKNTGLLYRVEEDDPNLISMNSPFEVSIPSAKLIKNYI